MIGCKFVHYGNEMNTMLRPQFRRTLTLEKFEFENKKKIELQINATIWKRGSLVISAIFKRYNTESNRRHVYCFHRG